MCGFQSAYVTIMDIFINVINILNKSVDLLVDNAQILKGLIILPFMIIGI